jgi:copper chaperone
LGPKRRNLPETGYSPFDFGRQGNEYTLTGKEVKMMSEMVLKIEGMKCMHCKMSVEKALKGAPGVTGVQVDLDKKQAVVSGTADQTILAKAVEKAGFKVAD